MIEEIGIPYAYYQFTEKTAQPPPFACFYFPGINDLYADNINYQRIAQLNLEIYTNAKDFELEEKVEEILKAHDLAYTKNETFLDSEWLNQTLYQMEVVIHE